MSLVRLLVPVIVLVAALAGCGGDDEATGTSPPRCPRTTLPDGSVTAVTGAAPAAGDGDDVVDVGEMVRVDYIGTLDDGEQFDSSFDRGDQFEFVAGTGQMIPGFDNATVVGMTVGETKTVTIPVADAPGERDEAAVVEGPIDEVPEEFRVEGMQVDLGNGLPADRGRGHRHRGAGRHRPPLAGEALTFEITVVEIVG